MLAPLRVLGDGSQRQCCAMGGRAARTSDLDIFLFKIFPKFVTPQMVEAERGQRRNGASSLMCRTVGAALPVVQKSPGFGHFRTQFGHSHCIFFRVALSARWSKDTDVCLVDTTDFYLALTVCRVMSYASR